MTTMQSVKAFIKETRKTEGIHRYLNKTHILTISDNISQDDGMIFINEHQVEGVLRILTESEFDGFWGIYEVGRTVSSKNYK